ncbi:hypothetical protein BgiBS90_020722, partial [Biomphalaria glabrata]
TLQVSPSGQYFSSVQNISLLCSYPGATNAGVYRFYVGSTLLAVQQAGIYSL